MYIYIYRLIPYVIYIKTDLGEFVFARYRVTSPPSALAKGTAPQSVQETLQSIQETRQHCRRMAAC